MLVGPRGAQPQGESRKWLVPALQLQGVNLLKGPPGESLAKKAGSFAVRPPPSILSSRPRAAALGLQAGTRDAASVTFKRPTASQVPEGA